MGKINYMTEDGNVFDNLSDAEKHSIKLDEDKAKEEKFKNEQKKRWQEVADARKKFTDLYEQYVKDYEDEFYYSVGESLLKEVFKI